MKTVFLASILENPGIIILLLVVVFGVIALTAWLIKKYVIDKKKAIENKNSGESEKPLTKEEIAEQELDRILEVVEDEETATKIKDYEEKND